MREFKASTKAGQRIIARYLYLEGRTLSDLYSTWSSAKQNAYDWCFEQFRKQENSEDFRVGSANTFGFSAGWSVYDENGNLKEVRLETKDNSYKVLMDM